jgi:hypothetical protein
MNNMSRRLRASLLLLGTCAAALPGVANTMVDPTRPAEYLTETVIDQGAGEIEWRLSAIRIVGGRGTAVLNGALVRAGDKLGKAQVVEINPGAVVLDQEGRRFVVELLRLGVKKESGKK